MASPDSIIANPTNVDPLITSSNINQIKIKDSGGDRKISVEIRAVFWVSFMALSQRIKLNPAKVG